MNTRTVACGLLGSRHVAKGTPSETGITAGPKKTLKA